MNPTSSDIEPGSKDDQKDDPSGVAAVDRAFLIVTAIEDAATPVSLSELSRLTGLYKSTILRLLASLAKAALVAQRPDLKYELGPLAFRLGRAYDASHPLRERVLASLNQLVEQGTESASFHVPYDAEHRLCLFRVDSRHSTLDNIKAGGLFPLDRGAPAKVIAHYSATAGKKPLSAGMPVFQSFGERDPSCAAVSCPVFDSEGQLIGALSLSGPRERYSDATMAHMVPLLLQEARRLTQSLGGRWPEGAS